MKFQLKGFVLSLTCIVYVWVMQVNYSMVTALEKY